MAVQFWIIHYLPKQARGNVLFGWGAWKKAVLIKDKPQMSIEELENNMFDLSTGKPVVETLNFCINPHCPHPDCAPAQLIGEF